MNFLTITAGLLLAAIYLIRRALWRAAGEGATEGQADLALYKAQLAEVDSDVSRKILSEEEAALARIEIKRRILDLDRRMDRDGSATAVQSGGRAPILALTILVILGAAGLYAWIGAPFYPDVPHAARLAAAEALKAARPDQKAAEAMAEKARGPLPPPDAAYADLMDKLREAVVAHPGDLQGLRLLARNERTLGNFSAAARAQEALNAALGAEATAMDYAALADVLILAAGNQVTAAADAAISHALTLDPANGTARFYAGLSAAQTGRPDLAFAIWNSLMQESPPEAPWVSFLAAEMPALAAAAGTDYQPPAALDPALRGPTAADITGAEGQTAEERAAMIAGMVNGLEERLMAGGGSAAEWAQLVRALVVLGQEDRVQAALAAAEAALGGDAEALAAVRAAAQGEGQ
ncbi:MAG: c-type cytochrome biogenesis protein CcmI [Paracoccaceae bacterium]